MISAETRAKYTATIGIECHVQLKTATKLFAAVGNDARGAAPNTLISHICFGLPGALPVLNEEAIHLASRAAFALGTKPQPYSEFERKHYFYPDLPMGYQISQLDKPIIKGGSVTTDVDGESKTIRINRAQLEADAGKNTHPAGKDYSLVDLNRAGTPLLEIVSEPDIHSAAEAKAYARELYLNMRYADVSDADLYHGNMRFDVNVSVSQDPNKFGKRTETKNLNSFRSVERVVEYEIDRQIELLEKGQEIVQETRGWDEAKGKTTSQRTKEEAHDYRYMPEPDIPPVVLDDDYIAEIENEMPIMPAEWRTRLSGLGLDDAAVETLLDAQVDLEAGFLQTISGSTKDKNQAKAFANWIINIEIPMRRELIAGGNDIKVDDSVRAGVLAGVNQLVKASMLSSNNASLVIKELLSSNEVPPSIEAYAKERGYIQVSDEGEIARIVEKVLAENPKAAEDVGSGEIKAIGFLVGQVMKQSRGKANPQLAQKLIKEQLGI